MLAVRFEHCVCAVERIANRRAEPGSYHFHIVAHHADALVTFICTSCGYFESFITDQKKLNEVAQSWAKVGAR